jgi:hypothetical protein
MGFFLYTMASRPVLGPTQPPIEWVLGELTPSVKWQGHEADYLTPSSANIKYAWSYTSIPPVHLH